jgi:uncharacterized protein (TIGR03067 family)
MAAALAIGWLGAIEPLVVADGAADSAPQQNKKELDPKKLCGRWRLDCFAACDAKTGEVKDLLGKLKHELIIEDGSIRMEIENIKFFEWKATYDIKTSPVSVDLIRAFPRDDEEKQTTRGVLELEGESLTIHLAEPGADTRPKDFVQRKGSESILIRCKRQK